MSEREAGTYLRSQSTVRAKPDRISPPTKYWCRRIQPRAPPHVLTHLPASEDVPGQLDFGKVALPDGPQEAIVAHVGLLLRTGGDGVPAAGTQGAAGPGWSLVRGAATAQGAMLGGGDGM